MLVKTKGFHLAPNVLVAFPSLGPAFVKVLAQHLRRSLRNLVSERGTGGSTFRVAASAVPNTGRVFVVITEKRRPLIEQWWYAPTRLLAGLLPGQFVIGHKRLMMAALSEAVDAATGLDR